MGLTPRNRPEKHCQVLPSRHPCQGELCLGTARGNDRPWEAVRFGPINLKAPWVVGRGKEDFRSCVCDEHKGAEHRGRAGRRGVMPWALSQAWYPRFRDPSPEHVVRGPGAPSGHPEFRALGGTAPRPGPPSTRQTLIVLSPPWSSPQTAAVGWLPHYLRAGKEASGSLCKCIQMPV